MDAGAFAGRHGSSLDDELDRDIDEFSPSGLPMHFAMDGHGGGPSLSQHNTSTTSMRIPGTRDSERHDRHHLHERLPLGSSFGGALASSLRSIGSHHDSDRSREEELLSASYKSETKGEEPIHRIVITGGHCSGRTTAIARLTGYLQDNGLRVFTVPEAASILFANGACFEDIGSSANKVEFQVQVMQMQIHLEKTLTQLARVTGVPCVVLCDRGLMDGKCYLSDEEWKLVKQRVQIGTVEARDQRYSAVFHLMTAAEGAEVFYQENTRRLRQHFHHGLHGSQYPTAEEAREFDARCQTAWTGHPRLTVIANRSGLDFDSKLNDLLVGVAQHVGIQVPREKRFRKYRLEGEPSIDLFPLDIPVEQFEVEKVYLLASTRDPRTYSFVRRRSQGGHASYTRTTCVSSQGQTIEMKKIISATEYAENVSERADPSRRTVRQRRLTFLYDSTHYEIYVYKKPCRGLSLLLMQIFSPDANPALPPFLPVAEEVTGQEDFSAYQLSVRSSTPGKLGAMSPRSLPLSMSSCTFSPNTPHNNDFGRNSQFGGDEQIDVFAGDDFAL